MFHKLAAIEPVSLILSAEQELHQYAEEVTRTAISRRTMMRSCGVSEMPMPCF